MTVLILSYYDAFPCGQGAPADDILCAKLKVETRGRMQSLHCALTSANCLGEELAKGCYYASLQDWEIVCVDKVTKVTKIVYADKVSFVKEHVND